MQNLNRICLYIIALLFCASCTNAQKSKPQEASIVRFTYTNWDRSSSILIGSDSVKMQKRIITSQDSAITIKIEISKEAVNYIADLVRQNCYDSVINGKLTDASATEVFIFIDSSTLDFWIQDKNKIPNSFLEKIIRGISASVYSRECVEIINKLTIYDRLIKHPQ